MPRITIEDTELAALINERDQLLRSLTMAQAENNSDVIMRRVLIDIVLKLGGTTLQVATAHRAELDRLKGK